MDNQAGDGSFAVSVHDHIFLLLAVCAFLGARHVRVGFRHARSSRHTVSVDTRNQHQALDLHGGCGLQSRSHQPRLKVMRRIRKTDTINDGIHAAGGRSGGAKVAQVGIENLDSRQFPKLGFQAGAIASHRAKRNSAPRQFQRHGSRRGARGAK